MRLSLSLFIALIWLILGIFYLYFFVEPYLLGASYLNVYGGDNFTYAGYSQNTIADLILHPLEYRNVSGMAIFSKFTFFFGEYNVHVALVMNVIFLYISLKNFRYIIRKMGINNFNIFILLMLFNIYIVTFLCSVNKEIIGIMILSYGVKFIIKKNYFKYLSLIIFSFYIRDAFAFFLIILVVMLMIKIPKVIYLLLISTAISYATPERQINILLEGQDENSLGLLVLLSEIQSYFYGYALVFIPKLLLNLFGSLSPLRISDAMIYGNIIGSLTCLSAIITSFLILMIVLNLSNIEAQKNRFIITILYAYFFIFCTPLFVNYRYLFPIYPFICILFLSVYYKKS